MTLAVSMEAEKIHRTAPTMMRGCRARRVIGLRGAEGVRKLKPAPVKPVCDAAQHRTASRDHVSA